MVRAPALLAVCHDALTAKFFCDTASSCLGGSHNAPHVELRNDDFGCRATAACKHDMSDITT